MPRLNIDLTTATFTIPEGEYDGTITKVEVKDSERTSSQYLRFTLFVPQEDKNIYFMRSLKKDALPHLKALCDKLDIEYTTDGFDPEALVNASVRFSTVIKDNPPYGEQNEITVISS